MDWYRFEGGEGGGKEGGGWKMRLGCDWRGVIG